MSQITQLTRRVDLAIAVYNGSGADIPAGTAVAFDATNPSTSTRAAGIKLTTSAADYVGTTHLLIKAGATSSLQVRGIGLGTAGATITFGTTLSIMSDSNGAFVPRTAGSRTAGIPLNTADTGEQIQFLMEASNAN